MTSSDPHDQTRRATRLRRALLVVLVVVLVACVGVSAWLVTTRGAEAVGIDGGASEVQSERDAVMSQARQFMLRLGTYDPEQLEEGELPEYRELVSEVITPNFRPSFDRQVVAVEQLVAQAGVSRTAEVFSAGAATLDSDSATVLVAGTFTESYPDRQGEMQPQDPVPFRMEVSLNRIDGEWLVDDFTPVSGGEQ